MGCKPRHLHPLTHPATGDLVHVLLGAARLRMAHVTPVKNQYPSTRKSGHHTQRRPSGHGPYLCICRTAPKLESPSRTGWKVDRASSVQATGTSTILPPSRFIRHNNSTSKANPVV